MIGDVNSTRYCGQTIYPIYDRSVRETFTLSGWAKGYGLPMHDRNGSRIPTFRLRARVKYYDTTYKEYGTEDFTADFSPCTEEWQFTSLEFSKSKYRTIQYIYIYCDYDYNCGTAFFDDIQLVRNSIETGLTANDFVTEEEEDTSYEDTETTDSADATEPESFAEVIDAFGNTVTETTFTDGEFGTIYRSFGYTANGNDLITETDARGNKTTYEVEANTSRNKEVTDRCGNKTAYVYDDAGRTIKVTSKNADGAKKVYLPPVLDMFNREIISYSISTSPNLQQIRDMLNGLFEKLPSDARPLFHSDQGWQYQHAEYQRLLAEHNITQSMSRKGNCMDNGIMENFFGRLKVEMYYGEKFESPRGFIEKSEEYIYYYNNERIALKLKGMSPVQYRAHSQTI